METKLSTSTQASGSISSCCHWVIANTTFQLTHSIWNRFSDHCWEQSSQTAESTNVLWWSFHNWKHMFDHQKNYQCNLCPANFQKRRTRIPHKHKVKFVIRKMLWCMLTPEITNIAHHDMVDSCWVYIPLHVCQGWSARKMTFYNQKCYPGKRSQAVWGEQKAC